MLQARSTAVTIPTTLSQALAMLADYGTQGAPFAGGTWIMRAPLRREAFAPGYVALGQIPELRRVQSNGAIVEIGASVTHAELAGALAAYPEFEALRFAAGHSANPAIRNAATIGGNLCAAHFPAADLVPALLCLEATVEMTEASGSERLAIGDFLTRQVDLGPGRIVTKLILKRSNRRSAHIRLPLRKAGDYPVAIVSMAADIDGSGQITDARVAVGSVEAAPRRWTALEHALSGQSFDGQNAAAIARSHTGVFTGREGVEAPSWYRVRVLPALLGRSVEALASAARSKLGSRPN